MPESAIGFMAEMLARERSRPPKGSQDNPYDLFIPGWLEDRYNEQGTTAQAEADRLFRYFVKVTVVR